jgi:hypothetical protein
MPVAARQIGFTIVVVVITALVGLALVQPTTQIVKMRITYAQPSNIPFLETDRFGRKHVAQRSVYFVEQPRKRLYAIAAAF